MKKAIAGIGFEIAGAFMFLFSSLIASMSLVNATEWDTQLGRYWQTVSDMGLFPVIIIGATLLILGATLCLWAFLQSRLVRL